MQKTSSIEAGQTRKQQNPSADLIDAINQVFSVFRINYHNQFYAAFTDDEKLNSAKKLWLQTLEAFQAKTLLHAANQLVSTSEYLPTLSKFVSTCDNVQFSLPSMREAYLEACMARSGKQDHVWSHPVVYHTGKACGWYLLRNQPEKQSWPIFKEHYIAQSKKIRNGETLTLPSVTHIETQENLQLDLESQKKRLAAIKATL